MKDQHHTNVVSHFAIRIHESTFLEAVAAGALSEDDILDFATHPYWGLPGHNIGALTESPPFDISEVDAGVSPMSSDRRYRARLLDRASKVPAFGVAGERLRSRIVELELVRGDAPTERLLLRTDFLTRVERTYAFDVSAALGAMAFDGKHKPWKRDESRRYILMQLLSVTLPDDKDTPEQFAERARSAGISDEVLVCLGVYAPQWAAHVEHTLGNKWNGFEDAVWWVHAHTRDNEYRINAILRKKRAAIAQRATLRPEEIKNGAVDAVWFHSVLKALGKSRWTQVYEAARFACDIGYKNAQRAADSLLGEKGAAKSKPRR